MKLHTTTTSLDNDPLTVFEGLAGQHDYCFLLETLADKYQPQTTSQSYIGVAPKHRFAAQSDKLLLNDKPVITDNPFNELRKHLPVNKKLPGGYVGGLVGYFGHEGFNYIEPSTSFPYNREFYDFEFAEYSDGLIFRPDQAPEYFYYDTDRSDLYCSKAKHSGAPLQINFKGAAKNYSQYETMIAQASEDIQNGRVFQVVLANKYEYGFSGDLLQLYRRLRDINPSPFMFFMKFGNVITLGASPELLAHTNTAGQVYLEALAGTIHRGKDTAEDTKLAKQLLADEKEIAEHSMLVDLARNDLGRISQTSTVKIEDLMYIKKLSHVQHISSIVSGQLRDDKDAFDALAASFPAGTLSGAPKIEAIKMISQLEGYERGPYGGTIGYFGHNGDSVHAVNIRSVSTVGNKLYLHSGSGIVYDSNADYEYQEVGNKKAAMDKAMQPFLRADT